MEDRSYRATELGGGCADDRGLAPSPLAWHPAAIRRVQPAPLQEHPLRGRSSRLRRPVGIATNIHHDNYAPCAHGLRLVPVLGPKLNETLEGWIG